MAAHNGIPEKSTRIPFFSCSIAVHCAPPHFVISPFPLALHFSMTGEDTLSGQIRKSRFLLSRHLVFTNFAADKTNDRPMQPRSPRTTANPKTGETYVCNYLSPLGSLLLASDGLHLTGLWFEGQRHFPAETCRSPRTEHLPLFDAVREWLDRYFAGNDPGAVPPLRPEGSAFQQTVWALLLKIPYGETTTYGDLARTLARLQGRTTLSAQAVGGAVGHNPISILIPCHRVVGHNGSLTGYAGGLDRKRFLLRLESARRPASLFPAAIFCQ